MLLTFEKIHDHTSSNRRLAADQDQDRASGFSSHTTDQQMKSALTAGAFASANDNAPSLWKAITDHSRLVDEERQTELRREHIIRRAQAFTWTVPANDTLLIWTK